MSFLNAVNDVLWHDWVLYTLLGTGLLFTLGSGLGQYRAMTHGVAVIRGRYDHPGDPGAISHFQALSAALSATVGLGNIAGVAIAVSLGGPGAVFWMWVTGLVGMALKMTEVTQAMMHRNLDRPDEPQGGPMWVVSRGLRQTYPRLAPAGGFLGGVFCVTLLISTVTGGNMFQAWNVADITRSYFGVPEMVTGFILALLTGLVILGGIRRIGTVAGKLVPSMCVVYLAASAYVLATNADRIPATLRSIVVHAFAPHEAQGAFLGSVLGWTFLLGMRRALFSNEAGQGSAPIAHSAARTSEPVREGIVAGLEPFIDTLVVCTLTALVILLTGVWNRGPEFPFVAGSSPRVIERGEGAWSLETWRLSAESGALRAGDRVFTVVAADRDLARQSTRHRLGGVVHDSGGSRTVEWETLASATPPSVAVDGIYAEYKGATLTAKAFDKALPHLGAIVVPAVAWLFAFSTMISWSYYGEQGTRYLFGPRGVLPYRIVCCLLILVATSPLIRTETELDIISSLGTGVMLWANVPIMLLFAGPARRAYRSYLDRLDAGGFPRSW